MKPKILLSANTKKQYYIDAVYRCGGIAEAQYCPEISTKYDGLILCGGNDINPKYYYEVIHGAVDIDEKRDETEFLLAKAFYEVGKPIMGICRGAQILNIFFGGSLYQHLDSASIHLSGTEYDCVHEVQADRDSLCRRLYGEIFSVNSAHHQAVKKLGKGLIPTVIAGDIIEGFEHETAPIFGFQWHPERMCFSQQRQDAVDGAKLFEYFIGLCNSSL